MWKREQFRKSGWSLSKWTIASACQHWSPQRETFDYRLEQLSIIQIIYLFFVLFFQLWFIEFQDFVLLEFIKKKEDKKQSKVQIYCMFHVKWNTSNVTFAIDSLLNTIQVKVLVYIWAYTDIDTVCWMSLSLSIGADAMAEWDGHTYREYGLIWKSLTLKDSLLTHQPHY